MIETTDLTDEALVPDYPPGCKRILTASDWYPTLVQPQRRGGDRRVEKIGTALDRHHRRRRASPSTRSSSAPGSPRTEFLAPMKVTGRDGRDLNEVWGGAARAYLGLSVPRFPNFFMLYGPNTNLGHNSILFMIEQQVAYTLSMLELMARRTAEGGRRDGRGHGALRRRRSRRLAADTVWAEGCHSWYKNAEGRITNNWVSYTVDYRTPTVEGRPARLGRSSRSDASRPVASERGREHHLDQATGPPRDSERSSVFGEVLGGWWPGSGTPRPSREPTKSMSGRWRSNMSSACGPGSPAPVRDSSRFRMAYERLLKITVVTFRPSRAWVHSAWNVYMAEPSASRLSTGRSGAATAAPVATGMP